MGPQGPRFSQGMGPLPSHRKGPPGAGVCRGTPPRPDEGRRWAMAYREVGVMEVRELLRLWGLRRSHREIARLLACDRKTVGRYLQAAEDVGLKRVAGVEKYADEAIPRVIELVQGRGVESHGGSW